jgi:NAD(P)H-dependent FMN reductase
MSGKLLALVGSPRKGGNTDRLVDEAVAAFREKGGETEKVSLSSLQIKPCQGCRACAHEEGLDSVCVQKDDMTTLYRKMFDADALLWATPIYMWSPTSQMKTFLDRLFPLGDYQTTRWRCALSGKSIGLLIVYAEPDPLNSGVFQTRDILKMVAETMGGELAFVIHASAGMKGVIDIDSNLISKVRAAVVGLA